MKHGPEKKAKQKKKNCPTGMATLRIWQCSSAHLHRGFPFATVAYLFNRTSEDETRLNAGSLRLENRNFFFNKYHPK